MHHQLFLIWHQFIKETREHRISLLGILLFAGAYTGLAASGRLENIQNAWGTPILNDNPVLPFLFTLAPGLFLVPFLAFADSSREADAFWVTKPLGTITVVGAKVLWIGVWLIGVPLIGDTIIVLSLGGRSDLGPIMLDFVLVRATYFFTTFALASLFNQLLHFTIAALCIPFLAVIFNAIIETFSPDISITMRNSPTKISALLIWCLWLPGISILIAALQYRYRLTIRSSALCALSAFAAGSLLASWPVDLLKHPIPSLHREALATDKIAISIDAVTAAPSPLTARNDTRDKLELEVTVTNIPPRSVLLLNRVSLTINTADQSFEIDENTQNINTYIERTLPIQRVLNEIIVSLKEELEPTRTEQAKIVVPLPSDMKIEQWEGQNVSIIGKVDFDLFDHYEFGRLELNVNGDQPSTLRSGGKMLTMHWPSAPSRDRYVEFRFRHFASNSARHNHELRSQWNSSVKSWHFIFRNREHDTYWNDMDSWVTVQCTGSSFCSLHVGRCLENLPTGFKADEVIVYASRYLGSTQREFKKSSILLNKKD